MCLKILRRADAVGLSLLIKFLKIENSKSFQKKKLKQKERSKTKKQREQESQKGQQGCDSPAAAHWANPGEWLAGIRQQPLQVRLDLVQWTRRADILHSWRELATWGGSHEGVPL